MLKNLIYDIEEALLDWRISRQRLTGVYHTDYELSIGANPVQSTDYPIIRSVLEKAGLRKTDNIADIGCGMGRFLGYLCLRGFTGHLSGIEIDRTYADFCTYLFRNRANLEIIHGNAIEMASQMDPDTVLYLYNPFNERALDLFLSEIRCRRLIYTNDVHRSVFLRHGNWNLQTRYLSHLNDGTPVGVSIFINQLSAPPDNGPNPSHPA